MRLAGIPELNPVKDVEELSAKLQPRAVFLSESEVFEGREIPIADACGTEVGICAALIAEGERTRLSEARGIEPLIQPVLRGPGDGLVASLDHVRT